jgi:hypothetical protein
MAESLLHITIMLASIMLGAVLAAFVSFPGLAVHAALALYPPLSLPFDCSRIEIALSGNRAR